MSFEAFIFIIAWLLGGFLAFDITHKYFKQKFGKNHVGDFVLASVLALTGPFGFLIAFFSSRFGKGSFR